MQLNESVVSPITDEYAIYIIDLSSPGYLNNCDFNEFYYNLNIDIIFDICLLMYSNTILNHSLQTTTIYLHGSIHSSE